MDRGLERLKPTRPGGARASLDNSHTPLPSSTPGSRISPLPRTRPGPLPCLPRLPRAVSSRPPSRACYHRTPPLFYGDQDPLGLHTYHWDGTPRRRRSHDLNPLLPPHPLTPRPPMGRGRDTGTQGVRTRFVESGRAGEGGPRPEDSRLGRRGFTGSRGSGGVFTLGSAGGPSIPISVPVDPTPGKGTAGRPRISPTWGAQGKVVEETSLRPVHPGPDRRTPPDLAYAIPPPNVHPHPTRSTFRAPSTRLVCTPPPRRTPSPARAPQRGVDAQVPQGHEARDGPPEVLGMAVPYVHSLTRPPVPQPPGSGHGSPRRRSTTRGG